MFKSWLYLCKTFKMCLFVCFLFVWNMRYWSTTQRKIKCLLRFPKTASRNRKSFFWNQWNYLLICTADLGDSVATFPSFDKRSFSKRKRKPVIPQQFFPWSRFQPGLVCWTCALDFPIWKSFIAVFCGGHCLMGHFSSPLSEHSRRASDDILNALFLPPSSQLMAGGRGYVRLSSFVLHKHKYVSNITGSNVITVPVEQICEMSEIIETQNIWRPSTLCSPSCVSVHACACVCVFCHFQIPRDSRSNG